MSGIAASAHLYRSVGADRHHSSSCPNHEDLRAHGSDRGIGPEEILKESVPVTRQDPYPIGQRLFIHDERLTGLIVHNLHRRIVERKAAARA